MALHLLAKESSCNISCSWGAHGLLARTGCGAKMTANCLTLVLALAILEGVCVANTLYLPMTPSGRIYAIDVCGGAAQRPRRTGEA